MSLQAIETVYNGYRFRSRLEERWAVFFDELEIKYEYESEGYDLGELGFYLPDFYLVDCDAFVEIKRDSESMGEAEVLKAISLCMELHEQSGKDVIVVFGLPDNHKASAHHKRTCISGYLMEINFVFFHMVAVVGYTDQNYLPIKINKETKISSAWAKAKQARFEHCRNG